MSGDRTCNACGQTERECLRGGGKCCNVCQHSDPAPSPSVPDPSDERALIVEISKAHKRHPGDPRRCYCGQFYGEGRGGWTYDSAPAEHLADVLLPALAAARPTSLPEAPEPDEMFYAIRRVDGEDLWDDGIKWAKANGPDDWDAADRDHDEPTGYEIVRMYAVPIARRTVHHDLSSDDRVEALPTPSAPPVAVDPEAGAGD